MRFVYFNTFHLDKPRQQKPFKPQTQALHFRPRSKPKPFIWGSYGREHGNRFRRRRMNSSVQDRKLYNLMKQLNHWKQIRADLKGKSDHHTFDLLWQLSQNEAALRNNIDELNQVNDGRQWYPMVVYNAITKECYPDISKFEAKEYEKYREKVNQHILNENMQKKMKEDAINSRIFSDTNKKMWMHLLDQADHIKQNVSKLGTEYHGGSWNANKDVWRFKDGEQRHEYGDSLCDLLRWYNLHENRQYNDS